MTSLSLFSDNFTNSVPYDADLRRVSSLPRRRWSDVESADLASRLTSILRTPHGEQELFPIQAIALYEIGTIGGLLGPIKVGAGKTLITFLAPEVSSVIRPVLLIPANLMEKTTRDRRLYSYHWDLESIIRIMTYEWLGREQAADALNKYQPDMIICDESHKLKNEEAAVTARVARYMHANPNTKFVALSGTFTKRSLHDYARMARWALGDSAPVPHKWDKIELWADALDERKNQRRRAHPGALKNLCNEEENKIWLANPQLAARKAYQRRLVDTPGVVATQSKSISASIIINRIDPPKSPSIDAAFQVLRDDWETPDGHPLADAIEVYRHAREMALGFYYVWDPRPPIEWLIARKEWSVFSRRILARSTKLDSQGQVALAYPEAEELLAWQEIKPTFKPNTVARWLCDTPLKLAAEWLAKHKGLC